MDTSEWVRNAASPEVSPGAEIEKTELSRTRGWRGPGQNSQCKGTGCEQESKGWVLEQRARGQRQEARLERQVGLSSATMKATLGNGTLFVEGWQS